MNISRCIKIAAPASLLIFSTMFASTAVQANQFEIKKTHIKSGGSRYFKRDANLVELGSYGKKKEPVTQANYIDPTGVFGNIGQTDSTPPQTAKSSSNFSASHNGDFAMPIKLVDLGISTSAYLNLIKNSKCTFVTEYVKSKSILKTNLNKAGRAKTDLKNMKGNSGRVVSHVIRAKSCEIKNQTIINANVKGNVELKKLKLKLKGDDSLTSESTINFTYGADTIIGYRMYKVIWDKNKRSKRKDIERLELDNQSFN